MIAAGDNEAHFDPGGQPASTADLFDYDVSRVGQRFLNQHE
jgi:hypothetical protein